MEPQLTLEIGGWFTNTRVRYCQADMCIFRNISDGQCALKEITINHNGDCEQMKEPDIEEQPSQAREVMKSEDYPHECSYCEYFDDCAIRRMHANVPTCDGWKAKK